MAGLSKPLYLTAPIVGLTAFVVLGVGIFLGLKDATTDVWFFVIFGSVGVLYAVIMTLVFSYKIWQPIQDGHARMSPGKAVGFLLIPFFNLYWFFRVIGGFSQDYNAYLDRYSINASKLPQGLLPTFSAIARICDAVNALPPREAGIAAPRLESIAASGPVEGPVVMPLPRAFFLYCLSGEFAHESVAIPDEGISIGRDPKRVNLVLAGGEISGVHARLLPQPESSQIWLEDLHSLNGTYYFQRQENGDAGWVQLQGRMLMSPGARFRLAEDGPEFEIQQP